MGIKNLKKIIDTYAPGCIVKRNLSEYYGKIIGIDISIYLYKFSYFGGNPITSIIMQAMKLMKNGIMPLYIFDGKPPKEKENELIIRSEKKKEQSEKQEILTKLIKGENVELQEKYQYYNERTKEEMEEELQNLNNSIIHITQKVKDDVKMVLSLMGVPYLMANGEAEVLCAKLNKYGYTDGSLSEDWDVLSNGGTVFIRNFTNSSNYVIEYDLNILLREMDITYEQFVDICILCGCDYTGTIQGIGYINAYKFIKNRGNIENILANSKYHSEECDYKRVREMFLAKIEYDELKTIKEKVELHQPSMDKLMEFIGDTMAEKNKKYVQKNLPILYWNMKDMRLK